MGTFSYSLRIFSMDGQQARDIEATVDTGRRIYYAARQPAV